MQKIDKIALVDAALAGQPVDRIPFSVWRRFPDSARAGKACADAHVAHYHKYDLDYLVVMNDNPYDMAPSLPVITRVKEWLKLQPLKGEEAGFRAMFETLHEIRKAVGSQVRFVATVHSPFAIAMKISRDRAVEHLHEDPECFEQGLSAVAQGLAAFARKTIDAGASGIFLWAAGAEPALLSHEEYRRFAKPYDVAVLSAVKDARFNIVHVHGTSVYADLFCDYPKSALNWPSHRSAYPISKVRSMTDRCLAAGIDERGPLAEGRMRGTVAEISDAVAQAGRTNFMFAPECAIPAETPPDLILAIKDLVAQL